MFPKAPKVEVYAPNTLFVGDEVRVEIRVTAEESTKIEYIDARLTGQQGWHIGSGNDSISARARYPELVARLRDEGTLEAGTKSYYARFTLPPGMPPSHAMAPAWAHVELFVRVAIPWWPDGKYNFTLPVRLRPPAEVARRPYAIRNTSAADEPRIELSLASTSLIAGETVVGSVAVFQLDDKKPRDVELTLVPSFRLQRYGRTRDRRGPTLGVTVTIPAGGAGTSVPFRFKLPADITPSFVAATHELAWWLVAKSGSFFGAKVEVSAPLQIYDASATATTERLTVAPRLTDERITGAFAQLASAHGWHQSVDEDDPDQLMYEREAGDATLRLGYAYRGKAGAFLVARVAYPSRGLDLNVTPSSRMRQMLSKDIEIDLADWDRTHHVLARSTAQTQPFLKATVPTVMETAKALGDVQHWSDDEIVFERQVSGVEVAELASAAGLLDTLAPVLLAAQIPAPHQLDVDVYAWKQYAQRLQGRCTPGDLAIDGRLDLRPVAVWLQFDGERPVRVHARVGEPTAGDDQSVEGSLPIEGRLDVERVKELVTKLRADLAQREPNQGPYR